MDFSLSNLLTTLKKQAGATDSKVVGIDLGSSSIKVVELENTDRAITLKTYGELQLGPYGETDLGSTVQLSEEKRIEALVDVLREANVKAKAGVLAMPLSSSFVVTIPLTIGQDEDIENKIPIEARKYIPVPLSDVILDWTELPVHGNTESSVHEVLLAAIQTDELATLNSIMRAVSMSSQPSEIEVFSAVRAIQKPGVATTVIIDMGAQVTKLYIANDGVLERIHRVSVGGTSITNKLAQLLQVSFQEAENMKRSKELQPEVKQELDKVTSSTLSGALQEFKRIIDQYESRTSLQISTVVLVGGVAQMSGVASVAREVLGRDVQIGNAFDKVAYPAFMEDTLKEIGPNFAVSLGAALRALE